MEDIVVNENELGRDEEKIFYMMRGGMYKLGIQIIN